MNMRNIGISLYKYIFSFWIFMFVCYFGVFAFIITGQYRGDYGCAMSTRLALDDVYSETLQWTMPSWGGELGSVPEAWICIQKGTENI